MLKYIYIYKNWVCLVFYVRNIINYVFGNEIYVENLLSYVKKWWIFSGCESSKKTFSLNFFSSFFAIFFKKERIFFKIFFLQKTSLKQQFLDKEKFFQKIFFEKKFMRIFFHSRREIQKSTFKKELLDFFLNIPLK